MNTIRTAVARVTLECTTPLTIGTGRGDDLLDSVCVTDANGLPAIPGPSLAGVLRHGLAGGPDGALARRYFGYQDGSAGESAVVKVSWAQVHGADDRPLPMRLERGLDALPEADRAFLAHLQVGVVRDHVRLHETGVVDGRGKFDERLVPRGARFTFELRVDEDARRGVTEPDAVLDALLGALAASTFRVGGRTRKGYGAVRVVRVLRRVFDLRRDHADWTRLPRALERPVPAGVLAVVDPAKLAAPPREGFKHGSLTLVPEDYWLFGGDAPTRPTHTRGDRDVAMVPRTELTITWANGRGTVSEGAKAPNLVQATGIKGALRHRTTFHLRALRRRWADDREVPATGAPLADGDDIAREVAALFGEVKGKADGGTPGRVYLGDAYVDTAPDPTKSDPRPSDGALDHVSIDRYTGAPMDGMLFSEAPLYRGTLRLDVLVDARAHATAPLGDDVRRAFARALKDLVAGRLAVGAGANRGHGYVTGRLEGDLATWLAEGGNDGR